MDATAALWRFFLQILGIQYSHRMVSQGLVDSSSVWWLRSLPLAGIGWKRWLVELITRPSGWFAWDDLWRVFLCGNKDVSVCFQSNFPRIWWYINYIYIYTHRYICIYNPRQKRGPLSWIYWIIESVNETLPFFQKKTWAFFTSDRWIFTTSRRSFWLVRKGENWLRWVFCDSAEKEHWGLPAKLMLL